MEKQKGRSERKKPIPPNTKIKKRNTLYMIQKRKAKFETHFQINQFALVSMLTSNYTSASNRRRKASQKEGKVWEIV